MFPGGKFPYKMIVGTIPLQVQTCNSHAQTRARTRAHSYAGPKHTHSSKTILRICACMDPGLFAAVEP